jgi:hypothetical protein
MKKIKKGKKSESKKVLMNIPLTKYSRGNYFYDSIFAFTNP